MASPVVRAAASLGLSSLVVDLSHSSANDLSSPQIHKEVCQSIREDFITCVGIEIVCATWSLARRAPQHSSMPSAVRDSHQYLFGLPNLVGKDAIAVKTGNKQYRYALQIIHLCIAKSIRGYLENPRNSRLFLIPGIQKLVRLKQAFFVDTHFCQYGTQWMKPTRFLVWGIAPTDLSLLTCSMTNGRCSMSGKRHLQLSGLQNGRFLTSAAQVYPQKLASHLMQQLLQAAPKAAAASPDETAIHSSCRSGCC